MTVKNYTFLYTLQQILVEMSSNSPETVRGKIATLLWRKDFPLIWVGIFYL